MAGWIKLYRVLLDKAIWNFSTPEQKTVLITLLLLANHDEKEWEFNGKKYNCKPGQFVTSLEGIAKKSGKGISIQNVRTSLIRFEKYNFLTNVSTRQNRLITICNWEDYQADRTGDNKEPNSLPTDDQQTGNKQVTTNKNYKKVKNDKNINKEDFLSKIITAFIDSYFDARQSQYVVTNLGKERRAASAVLNIYKAKFPDLNTDEILSLMSVDFVQACLIQDKWHNQKMSLSHFANSFNELNIILKNGNRSLSPRGTNVDQLVGVAYASHGR